MSEIVLVDPECRFANRVKQGTRINKANIAHTLFPDGQTPAQEFDLGKG
ncbi:hypothetical protein [uncultured Maritimibacter sp.]|nr:hypothetical protein [uncultured Maritimibacter sp.]